MTQVTHAFHLFHHHHGALSLKNRALSDPDPDVSEIDTGRKRVKKKGVDYPIPMSIDMMPEDIVAEYRLPSNIGMSFMYVVGGCFDCICLIEKYRKWLIPSDPSTNHNNAIQKHHLHTGFSMAVGTFHVQRLKTEAKFLHVDPWCL